jgi:hypothetical protein
MHYGTGVHYKDFGLDFNRRNEQGTGFLGGELRDEPVWSRERESRTRKVYRIVAEAQSSDPYSVAGQQALDSPLRGAVCWVVECLL